MRMSSKLMMGVAIPAIALAMSNTSNASSHREAPAISDDPAADNTDTYAWMSTDGTRLYVVANWIPLEEPAGGPNFHKFSDTVRYEIRITRGVNDLVDDLYYTFQFTSTPFPVVDPADLNAPLGGGKEFFSQISGQVQTYSILKNVFNGFRANGTPRYITTEIATGLSVAPSNIGPRTDAVLRGGAPYDDAFAATFIHDLGAQGRVFAGPRDDGFYVDLGGVFDLANLRPAGTAQDNVAGYNTHTIAMEIPLTQILPANLRQGNGTAVTNRPNDVLLGVWTASSRRAMTVRSATGPDVHSQPWVQVSRLGLPLINEAVIGLQDKDRWNRLRPSDDVAQFAAYFLNPVIVRDAEAVGIYAALGVDPTPFKSNRFDILDIISLTNYPTPGAHAVPLTSVGDVLRVAPDAPNAFPNGRALQGGVQPNQEQADVTDVLLSVLLAGGALPVSDGVNHNDRNFLTTFPFLPLPHQGFAGGHGVPAP